MHELGACAGRMTKRGANRSNRPRLPQVGQSLPSAQFVCSSAAVGTTSRPPKWIKPQLTRLVDEAPPGDGWLHEIKFDGYRMHARIDGGKAKLLTRTGLDWSHRYGRTVEALQSLK